MERSSHRARHAWRFAFLCLVATAFLVAAVGSRPWATRKAEAARAAGVEAADAGRENVAAPAFASYTLNQYIYPGSASITVQTSGLASSSPQVNAWSAGVPLVHVFTIGNSNQLQTSLANITLDIANSLGSNFVLLGVTCQSSGGAQCPPAASLPPMSTPLPLSIPNIMIKFGSSTDIVVFVRGYYTAPGTSYTGTFSVIEQTTGATRELGPDKTVQITSGWPMIDLAVTKTGGAASGALPQTINYTVTVTGDAAHDFHPGGLIKLRDQLTSNHPPALTYTLTGYNCASISGNSTCPAQPSLTPTSTFQSANTFNAYYDLNWPTGPSTVIKKGDTLTITFQINVSTTASCGDANVTVKNQAFYLSANDSAYGDADNSDNATLQTSNSFTTGLQQPCVPAAGATKTRVCPASGCPAVNWGDTVTYQITVTNNTSTPQNFQVRDYLQKPAITAPFTATLVPTGTASGVQCSQPCTTNPSLPQNVIADNAMYQLFDTSFTLAPAGTQNATITLTFSVKIDKLSECQTDAGNSFFNFAQVYSVVPGTPTTYTHVVNSASVVVPLPELDPCGLKVTKTLDPPLGEVKFGQPVSFDIVYENTHATQTVVARTLRDILNIRDASNPNAYGNIPITNLTVSCTPAGGVSPMPFFQPQGQIFASSPGWSGITVIQEAVGITFPPGSQLKCTVTFTPQPPSATDNLCQGKGKPEIVNNAYVDVSGLHISSSTPKPPVFAEAAVPLPLCRRVSVLKTVTDAAGNALSGTGPNGLLTFQIEVRNDGSNPVSDFVLSDPLPPGFTPVSGSIVCPPGACAPTPGFTGGTLNVSFNPIPGTNQAPLNTVVITFQAHASLAGGTYYNTATGSFTADTNSDGTGFYFEGDPGVLLVNSAQVQVLTPTLTKKFTPAAVTTGGTATVEFTITNQNSDPPQTGISFTDQLPAGVTVTNSPATACGGTVSVGGGNVVTLSNASLAQGQHTCTFSVEFTAASCGTFRNDRTKFTNVTNLDATNADATLTVTGCVDPTPTPTGVSCDVKLGEISCDREGGGGYVYTFNVTNTTGLPVTDVLVTPPHNSNFTITPQRPPLPGGVLDPGKSVTLQVHVGGGRPGQRACLMVTLMTRDGPCCTVEVCPVLPECCGRATNVGVACAADGTYTYSFSVVNTSTDVIRHIYMHPPPGVTMTPNYFAVTLAPGDTFQSPPIKVSGARPERLCFRITLHTDEMKSCCDIEHCVGLPDCPDRR